MRLWKRLVDETDQITPNDGHGRACVRAIEMCGLGRATGLHYATEVIGNADKALKFVLRELELPFSGSSSIFTVQILTLTSFSLRRWGHCDEKTSSLIAVAARMAFDMSLHLAHNLPGLDFDDRLEQFQTFWSLYTLDTEASMHKLKPPCISEDEIDGMYIEPPMYGKYRTGLTESAKGAELNLFAARQRLARIGGQIWRDLYSAKALIQHPKARQASFCRLNKLLEQWKAEWFDFGPSIEVAASWSVEAITHIKEIHDRYFTALVRTSPDTVVDPLEAIEILDAGGVIASTSMAMFTAAREMLNMPAPGRGAIMSSFSDTRARNIISALAVVATQAARIRRLEDQISDFDLIISKLDSMRRALDDRGDPHLLRQLAACQSLCLKAIQR